MTPHRAQAAAGRKAMVVSGHGDATKAAWQVLASGGSVADAAIAGAAVLAVTQPQACTLGGDAFALVHDAARARSEGLNASGPSPRLATRERFGNAIPQRGAAAASVPGAVGGWGALHERHGKMPWNELLQPAIDLARKGCAASSGLARSTETYADLIRSSEAMRSLFHARNRPLAENERFTQPALARTLEAIAGEGAASFYQGTIAHGIAKACAEQGGLLRQEDFSGFVPEWVAPIEVSYRSYRVRAMPPNSYGLYLLLQLLYLEEERLERETMDSPRRIAALARAAQAAFALGKRAVADPRFAPEPFEPLLGPEGRRRLRESSGEGAANRGGTAVISVMDSSGNAVTLVQSIFLVFGSGCLDPETGILLNDRMIGFTTEPGHPNEVAPRKRPAHTLCPCQVFDAEGKIRYALGTPGGPGQTLTIAQVLQAAIEERASLADAISAPRWSQDLASKAVVEDAMPEATVEGVRSLGLALEKAQPGSPYFGSAEGIERSADGSLKGVADFRRDASAYGE
ncbi:MAG: gamma-glutamyltransferase [Betaproteobacteria bacterium]|nr:gamma-glutamyltransferase [Betaproteobacteria bacterium]